MARVKVIIHFDGGCRMKRNIAAGAAVIFDENGKELATEAKVLRDATTNVAEYTGLIIGLIRARQIDARQVKVLGDSELVVRQVNGVYRCTKPHLAALRDYVLLLMQCFEACEIIEFPKAGPKNKRRYGNDRADQLANEAMDAALAISST